jgi:L-alanine-DL-glutamate epimerase-like enolase superfamily enzyme
MELPRLHLERVRWPLRRPFRAGTGAITVREGFLVFVEGREAVGVGEALPLPSSGTETLEQCGQALHRARTLEDLDATPAARFAVETALLDLEGRTRGVPVSALLSETPSRSVAVNGVIDASEDAVAQARALKAEGFRCFKLKLPGPVAAVREVIGPHAELRLDANGQWSRDEALAELRALKAFRPEYCEDPTDDPADVAALRACGVPIAADAWLARGTDVDADVLVIKPAVVGGLKRAVALAQGRRAVITTTVDGVVGRLAALHVAAALGGEMAHGLATGRWIAQDDAADPAPVVRGRIAVPQGGGLGLNLGFKGTEVAA